MNAIKEGARDQVTGIVRKVRMMRDDTVRFSVMGKGFERKFSLRQSSPQAKEARNGNRVLILSTDSGRVYPKVERILPTPTGYQIAEASAWVSGKSSLPD